MKKTAVILLSGGLDSTTVLAIAKSEGFEPWCITFRYGQRHQFEIESAKKIAKVMNVARHIVFDLDLSQFGGSALTDHQISVPKGAEAESPGIPPTYVPARNTVFLSIALAWAEVLDAQDIFIGVNAIDYSGYPDCRPEYIEAFEKMANLATKMGIEGKKITIHTPLIHLSKKEIILKGLSLGVDYSLTHSCYSPNSEGKPCGECAACQLRKKGFKEAGLSDPALD
ncbi:MAG: 7-cyano-7-deazaguanine synthase QueC [Planctomycetota bacterium]|nr:MAG: 7-cyano-7-deazaguanine synthase QueC [Planctomycetota bacterium]